MSMIAVEKREGKWWILDDVDPEPIGPYDTRAEAEDDARGLRRFAKWGHLRSFITTEQAIVCLAVATIAWAVLEVAKW